MNTTHIATYKLALAETVRQMNDTADQMEADALAIRYEANRLLALAADDFAAPIKRPEQVEEAGQAPFDPEAIPSFLGNKEGEAA